MEAAKRHSNAYIMCVSHTIEIYTYINGNREEEGEDDGGGSGNDNAKKNILW